MKFRSFKFTLLVLVLVATSAKAQDRNYAQSVIDTLSSSYFHGRGYVNRGEYKAARFIENEFRGAGVESFYPDYFHRFRITINSFPGAMSVKVNGSDSMVAGRDFIVDPASRSVDLKDAPLYFVSLKEVSGKGKAKRLARKCERKGWVPVLPIVADKSDKYRQGVNAFHKNFKGDLIVQLQNKLTWGTARNQLNYGMIHAQVDSFSKKSKTISVNIRAELLKGYQARNVIAKIEGQQYPDSFVFVTAHYDHLGQMGEDIYIPGANDNASGVAMMLDLARYYSTNPPPYTMVFVAFGGEEAGLVGSYHLVQQLVDEGVIPKIKFLVNLDLMGSGQEGIMAVNGRVFEKEYAMLEKMNSDSLLPAVKARGKAANSDHYFFTEVGVHAFFFYLMGPYHFYHEVDDSAENLRLTEYYDRSYELIQRFLDEIQKPGN